MYFINEKHRGNYKLLMDKYHLTPEKDVQYESNIYIAAFPEIFEAIDLAKLEHSSPLFPLTKWDEEEGKHIFTAPGLTGSTRRMCELALSLYNGYPVSLDEIFGSVVKQELLSVLFQAMKIRAKNRVF